MRVLGIQRTHNGGVAVLEDGRLSFALESEKDSHARYSELRTETLATALERLVAPPEVIVTGGWWHHQGGYEGLEAPEIEWVDGAPGADRVARMATSHERAHILGAYGMSPFAEGRPCYALLWEGVIGSLYDLDADLRIRRLATPLSHPGQRYAFLYELADPEAPDDERGYSIHVAGKLMALASYAAEDALPEEDPAIRAVLEEFHPQRSCKGDFRDHPCYNVGLRDPYLARVARGLSDAIFGRFQRAAAEHCEDLRPLLISGGCGLNCDWNSGWRSSGLFEDVFVPPCPDDSGVALGAAVDGLRATTGRAKIEWSVACGDEFVADVEAPADFARSPYDPEELARLLAEGAVVAFVQGRYELGPRALGNRSILASPFSAETRDRLNEIKHREEYRPVAPVCLEERVSDWFHWQGPSPHMLYFARSRGTALGAVTHVDGSARVQTVSAAFNPALHALLVAFAAGTGAGVLCNTSLNFHGRGFINRMSDLVRFVRERRLDGMVVGDDFYGVR